MTQNLNFEQLFKRCDTRGDGFIGQKEFRDLCRDFDIDNPDADIIFYDLDHDGDGQISFEDFAFGFRDFVTPNARRGSIQLGLAGSPSGKGKVSRTPSFRNRRNVRANMWRLRKLVRYFTPRYNALFGCAPFVQQELSRALCTKRKDQKALRRQMITMALLYKCLLISSRAVSSLKPGTQTSRISPTPTTACRRGLNSTWAPSKR
jgi:hypothetical protein